MDFPPPVLHISSVCQLLYLLSTRDLNSYSNKQEVFVGMIEFRNEISGPAIFRMTQLKVEVKS